MQNFTVYHAKFLFPNFFQRKNCSNTTKILTSYGRATFDWILCVSSKKSRYNLFPQCLLITLIKLIHMSSIYLAALQTVAVTRRPFKIWRAEIITNRPPTTPSVGSSSHWQCAVLTNVNKKRRNLSALPITELALSNLEREERSSLVSVVDRCPKNFKISADPISLKIMPQIWIFGNGATANSSAQEKAVFRSANRGAHKRPIGVWFYAFGSRSVYFELHRWTKSGLEGSFEAWRSCDCSEWTKCLQI